MYMYKQNLALHNLQWLICHKTKQNQTFYLFHIISNPRIDADDCFKFNLHVTESARLTGTFRVRSDFVTLSQFIYFESDLAWGNQGFLSWRSKN